MGGSCACSRGSRRCSLAGVQWRLPSSAATTNDACQRTAAVVDVHWRLSLALCGAFVALRLDSWCEFFCAGAPRPGRRESGHLARQVRLSPGPGRPPATAAAEPNTYRRTDRPPRPLLSCRRNHCWVAAETTAGSPPNHCMPGSMSCLKPPVHGKTTANCRRSGAETQPDHSMIMGEPHAKRTKPADFHYPPH